MTQLALLKTRLGQLRRQRQWLRWGTAWAGGALTLIWTGVAAFAIDWSLEMTRGQRIVLLAIACAAVVWAFRRYALPWLGEKESEIDLALMIERQQNIDSDLVAALQFESPESPRWGSAQLEHAVIDYVADFSRDLHVYEGIAAAPVQRRLRWLGFTIVPLVVLIALFPGHWSAFVNRMLLGNAHYPTQTVIERIFINEVSLGPSQTASREITCPYGRPLKIKILCRGEAPREGIVVLRGIENGARTEIPLAATDATGEFVGELPRLVDSVQYEVYLGDAWTDAGTIRLISLPVVTIELQSTPPTYAAATPRPNAEEQPGTRQISVIEGSRVDLTVVGANKPLKEVQLTIDGEPWPLEASEAARRTWKLTQPNSPFASVASPRRYEIQVVDDDGLSLEQPIQGSIRIKADRPPRVAAAMISRRVLPTAKPKVAYGAADDYGLSKLVAQVQIDRENGESENRTLEIAEIPAPEQPRDLLRGEYVLDLDRFGLKKGDEVRVTLEAFDYRGELPAKSAASEPLVLEVTDREGILASLLEADEKSARQLDAIIRRELGIGESK